MLTEASIEILKPLVDGAVFRGKGRVAAGEFSSREFAGVVQEEFGLGNLPGKAWCESVLSKLPFVEHRGGQTWRRVYRLPSHGEVYVSRFTGQRMAVARLERDPVSGVVRVALSLCRTGQVLLVTNVADLERDFERESCVESCRSSSEGENPA